MRMQWVPIEAIHPYPNNPRINDEAVAAVEESIAQCTYVTPIVLDEDGVILAGHTRYRALRNIGVDGVQCVIYEGLTEEQKKKFRYLDNKTGEKATWDISKLASELEGLDLQGFNFFGLVVDLPMGEEMREQDTSDISTEYSGTGAKEINTDEYGEEAFKYKCPKCGFMFN